MLISFVNCRRQFALCGGLFRRENRGKKGGAILKNWEKWWRVGCIVNMFMSL